LHGYDLNPVKIEDFDAIILSGVRRMPNAVEGPHGARNYREPIDILKPRLRLTGTLPQEVCLDFRRPSGMLSLPAHTRR